MPHDQFRVLLVGSSGGHLAQLLPLEPWYRKHERRWVTFRTPDAQSRLEGEDVVWGYHPTTRNLPNLLRNTGLAIRHVLRFRPAVVVSTGAGIALPFFILGRLTGAKTVYIEVVDRLDTATMTAKLCRPFTSLFCVQWPEQRRLYKGAVEIGRLM